MPHHGIKDSFNVKEQFHLEDLFDPKEIDRRVTHAQSYAVLLYIWNHNGVKLKRLEEVKFLKDNRKACHHWLMLQILIRVNH